MKSVVNPQPTDPHLRIAHTIHRELVRRNFTKRQRNIIDFVLTLSWGCGKHSAVIPKLKDFSLCGVHPNHIRNELKTLVNKNVICWEGSMNLFQLNKHFDQWDIPIVDDYDQKEMDKIISFNIENKSPNLSKKLPEKGSDFPKKEVRTSQKGYFSLPKKGSRLFKLSHTYRVKWTPKESIKASIKKRILPSFLEEPIHQPEIKESEQTKEPESAYESFYAAHIRVYGFALTQHQSEKLGVYIDQDGLEETVVIRAIERAAGKGGPYRFGLITKILDDYFKSKALTLKQAIAADDQFKAGKTEKTRGSPAPIDKRTKQQRELDELRRKREEARQRGGG